MSSGGIRVLQVSNISPTATRDQVQTLFGYIGRIEECRVYPSALNQTQPKFSYIKFDRESAVELGQHLTNVVFIDRALVCVPAQSNRIPDEETALRSGPTLPGQRQLPPNVTSSIQKDSDGLEMLYTNDPTITALGLTPYPPLPSSTEMSKVEEIRRTVYIGNLEKGCDGEQLMQFLNATIGEVMYLRMAGNEHLPCAYAYVEFSNQESVPLALQNNGIDYNGRALKIQHSRVAIIKPKQKTADQALEEVEEAIRVNENRGDGVLGRGYSPATDRGNPILRRRSRSPRRRSPSPRRRSPSYDDRRSGSRRRSPSPRRRSPSPRRRSPSYDGRGGSSSRRRSRSPHK
jgi:arginine/serine-rich splicing factor 12